MDATPDTDGFWVLVFALLACVVALAAWAVQAEEAPVPTTQQVAP